MNSCLNLRGLVLSKFKNLSDFAKAMNWKRNKAYRIVNGIQELALSEIEKIVEVLDIKSVEEFLNIFFVSMSTKWTL